MQDLLARIGVNINVAFHLIFLGLIWMRCLAMAAVAPFLFGRPVPRYVMVGASMVLALFVYPALVPLHPPELSDNLFNLFMLFLKEAFYGIALGMSVAVIFYGFEAAGAMIDGQRGLSMARILIPQLGEQGSITGSFLYQLAIVIYLAIGGHRAFFTAFFESYRALPLLAFPHVGPGVLPLMNLFVDLTGTVLLMSLQLAAPIIIAIFIADVILGIANRIAPQINVWELGFNVKGYVGILLLFVSLSLIVTGMEHYTIRANQATVQAAELLKGQAPSSLPPEPPEEQGLQHPEAGPPPVISP